ncbi:MAG: hypothetical protein HY673_00070 [Chloroflexi bacterium]|nr:hypothetical protein [Chloroflexota bacterium]
MVTLAANVLDEIDKVNCRTERVKERREELREAKRKIVVLRSRLITESWKETEGEPLFIRRARLLQKLCEEYPVFIREGELIVGSLGPHVRSAITEPELNANTYLQAFANEGKKRFTVEQDYLEAEFDRQEREMILEDAVYWKDSCISEHKRKTARALWGNKLDDFGEARLCDNRFKTSPFPIIPHYKKVLSNGLSGLISEVEQELRNVTSFDWETSHKVEVWRAMVMACQATITYARRHAELARQLAEREADVERKKELEKIADICDWVPANPARSFHEAVQSVWFIDLALVLEAGRPNFKFGRLDQYLYHFYQKDIQDGKISRQKAAELLACLWVKVNEPVVFKTGSQAEASEKSEAHVNTTIGGVDADGRDATNELSYLILEVEKQMKLPQPYTALRYHDGLSQEFLIRAIDVTKEVGGKPMLINDKMAILNLCSRWGFSLSEARDWDHVGCGNIYSSNGVQHGDAGLFNLAKVLEITLNNGVDPRTGRRLGIATGEPRNFNSFNELCEALKNQYSFVIKFLCDTGNFFFRVEAETFALPFHSVLVDDCIKKGLGCQEGGLRHLRLQSSVDHHGHVNVADSLTAIKKLVFEDKAISMDELLEALAANFEGKEKLRAMLLAAPKYGNDDDYADQMLVDVYKWSRDICAQQLNIWGYPYRIGGRGMTRHRYFGKTVGALPDGRRAYEPLADGSLSPMRGADVKGPTAVLNSASKVDPFGRECTILNQKFFKSAVAGGDGMRKLLALIKTYFDRYGYHIQFNLFDPQTLLEAKKHPEKYRDLIVRVAGFSAYFVELSSEIQDEIIARTTQGL